MSCGYQCNEIGGPWIAENPDCPIHGSDGIGDKMEEMQEVIREFIHEFEPLTPAHHALLARAQDLL